MDKQKERIKFDYSESETVFTDIIELQIKRDVACLGIALINKDGNATISHRVYMSMSQFITLHNIMTEALNDVSAAIEKIKLQEGEK